VYQGQWKNQHRRKCICNDLESWKEALNERVKIFYSDGSTKFMDLWSPPSLVSNGTNGSFPGDKAAGVVKLTIHHHLVPRSIMSGATPPLPQFAFMVWCSVKKAQGKRYLFLPFICIRVANLQLLNTLQET